MKKLPTIFYMLMMLMAIASASASAQDRFYLDPISLEPGTEDVLTLMLDISDEFYGFSAEVRLPEGLEVIKKSDGKLDISLNPERTADTYQIISNINGGILYMGAFSDSPQTPIRENSGALVYIKVKVAEDYHQGSMTISNIKLIDPSDHDIGLTDNTTIIKVFPTAIRIEPSVVNIVKSTSTRLTPIFIPVWTTDFRLSWSSSDESVASIGSDGTLTAVEGGMATITAMTPNGKTASCIVNVTVLVTDVLLDKEAVVLEMGDTDILTATVLPDNASDKTVTWSSSNPAVATVDDQGKITALDLGEAIITATCGGKSASCTVTVIPTSVESIEIDKSAEIAIGESLTLTATLLPETVTDKTITWTSANPAIATVDASGSITGVALGEVIITASCGPVSATCTVTVVPTPVESITVSPQMIELKVGESSALTATLFPETSAGLDVTWSTSNEGIASVDASGTVTGITPGYAIVTATCGTVSASCTVTVVPVTAESITLSAESARINVGETTTLSATVLPDNTADKTVVWSSADPAIASVDASGTVTGMTTGVAVITATCGSVSATCTVTVTPAPAESITVSPESAELKVGETVSLTTAILPEIAALNPVTWSSSDPSIATVEADGTVTGVALGMAVITATCDDVSATCNVTVVRTPVESITPTNATLLLRVGHTADNLPLVYPDNATDKSVTWSSSDPSIASVDQSGLITALEIGTAIVTITSVSDPDVTAEIEVTVISETSIVAVTGITLIPSHLDMTPGESATLTAEVQPDAATDKSVTWSSSDPSIATVTETGQVTAIATGSAIIYASSSNGLTAECSVTVNSVSVNPTGISLSNTEMQMFVGDVADLIAIVHPDNAIDKTVTWSSSDETIATVDGSGIITALEVGDVTITATTSNGLTARCLVTVNPRITAVSGITISETEKVVKEGEIFTLFATVTPDDATDKTVTWKSSDITKAIVTADGVVTAVTRGTVTIYASSSNGLTAECFVTIEPGEVPVTSISLTNTEMTMIVGDTAELLAILRPDGAADKTVIWSSSDESVATVDLAGIVTALKVGMTTITATSSNGLQATCLVTVITLTDVASISLPPTLEMNVGQQHKLTATITPDDATDKSVTWRSSDRSIVTVSEDGMVTAIAEGSAIIYASTSNGLTAECIVTVNPGNVEVTGISLTNVDLLMMEGDTAELMAIIRPSNATDPSVIWSSSDETIATVDNNGVVTAIKAGKAVITATSSNGITAICNVTVEARTIIPVESIIISETELIMEVGEITSLTATVLPLDATDRSITWRSSDRSIVTVSEDGELTAVAVGEAIIYASSSNGLTAECHVTVIPGIVDVTGISLTNIELIMREGDVADLIAIIRPENATDKSVVWSSSDETVATVDQNGIVTAIKVGQNYITATASNGLTAVCKVTVIPLIAIPVAEITVSPVKIVIKQGETYELTAKILPDDATDKTLTWVSSDRAIAIASQEGIVTGIGVGEAIVYVSSSNGLTAECHVTVIPGTVPVTGITLTNYELLMREGHTSELMAIVRPDNADDKTVIWSSSDPSVATVDQNGVVTAIKVGFTTVTASTVNGFTAVCAVTVVPEIIAVSDISVDPKELTLTEGDTFALTATVSPDNAGDKTVTWRSGDRMVATVDADGVVTAVSPGNTVIYVSSSNGLTVECALTVVPRVIEATAITLDKETLEQWEGESDILTATITPDDATDRTVIWTSANSSIARVTDGIVVALSAGTTVITASTSNGKSAQCTVTVYERPITPKQLLRKGDGTTSTFVVMMDMPDAQLAALGYRYATGYTDSEGVYTIISETPLRYCHTTPEIFNDPELDFWAYTFFENADGKIISSNLRHLYGSEEVNFDTSGFRKNLDRSGDDTAEWLIETPTTLQIVTATPADREIAVFDITGRRMYYKACRNASGVIDEIDRKQLPAGAYVVTLSGGGINRSKRIVIR